MIGAGIYVEYATSSSTKVIEGVQGPQPADGYANIDRLRGSSYYYRRSSSNTRLDMFCCSNTTSLGGTLTTPNGYIRTSGYWNAQLYRYHGTDTYAGCIRLTYTYSSGYSLYLSSYSGIHTCIIPDSEGNNLNVNIGIYDETFSSKVSHACMQYNGHGNANIPLQPRRLFITWSSSVLRMTP